MGKSKLFADVVAVVVVGPQSTLAAVSSNVLLFVPFLMGKSKLFADVVAVVVVGPQSTLAAVSSNVDKDDVEYPPILFKLPRRLERC
jgi:hypothetical protein